MSRKPFVLAAVDGSPSSMDTVTYLSRMLSPAHTGIELLHVRAGAPEAVFDLGDAENSAEYDAGITRWRREDRSAIAAFMDKALQCLVAAGFPRDAIIVTRQDRQVGIARDIINRSRLGCAAVALGRRGTGTLPEFLLGSVAAKLAESIVHVPLVLVGGPPADRKVLVAFDRSPHIIKGLEQVGRYLTRDLEEILLCHIVRPLSMPHQATAPVFTSRHESQWLDENTRKIIPAMVAAKQALSSSGFDTGKFSTAILKEKTSRADGLAKEARAMNFGTILVGRRGASAVAEFSMGRVTRKLLSLAWDKAIWIV